MNDFLFSHVSINQVAYVIVTLLLGLLLVYNVLMVIFGLYIARNAATRVPLIPHVEQVMGTLFSSGVKHDKTGPLSNGQAMMLREQIEKLMEEKLLFLDADLSIHTVAELLNTNRSYISYVLNHCMNTNFNEFVNVYRVGHVKHLMLTTDMKLSAIAYESGFNSPGSMSRTFKAITGLSPHEYRQHPTTT